MHNKSTSYIHISNEFFARLELFIKTTFKNAGVYFNLSLNAMI